MSDSLAQHMQQKLADLNPEHIEILNESHMHSGPATDSHYKLILVSEQFAGKRPVARHQAVYGVLADELAGPVHALALHLYTPQEWQETGAAPVSPNCRGGSKG